MLRHLIVRVVPVDLGVFDCDVLWSEAPLVSPVVCVCERVYSCDSMWP